MEKTIEITDATHQSAPVSDKERRDIFEDGKNADVKPRPETQLEKEASYKHESGNPQAEIAADVREHIQQKDNKLDKPEQEVGSKL